MDNLRMSLNAMDELSKRNVALIGNAIFNAQNELGIAWQHRNTGTKEDMERQTEIRKVQAKLIKAVRVLGGVDYLIDLGA